MKRNGDYQLNKKLINDKFPLTNLDDVLEKIGRAKYFSILDMTTIFTSNGYYQFKKLSFGLKISFNSFQRVLTIALTSLDSNAFIYVDDVIVFGYSWQHHNYNLTSVSKVKKPKPQIKPK